MKSSVLRRRMPVTSLTDPKIVLTAIGSALAKLHPRAMMKNPVMFVVEIVAVLTTVIFIRDWINGADHLGFTFQIIFWLWFTVLFANFAEAVAEGRGKAQAASLRQTREETKAKLIVNEKTGLVVPTRAGKLGPGQIVLVEAGDLIPSDGEVIEGVASVNEAAITGESAPVIREAGGDRSAVTGGTLVVSDWLKVRITAAPGLDLPRSDDRLGGRRRAAEDAERDCVEHPSRGYDDHLHFRHGNNSKLRRVWRRRDLRRRSRCSFRHAHSNHDRRALVGDRHRRDGPPRALQCACDVGPRGRGRRRR